MKAKNNFKNDLSKFVYTYRVAHNWSQRLLAEKIGIGYSTMRRIENGDKVHDETLMQLVKYFGCDRDKIFKLYNHRFLKNDAECLEEVQKAIDILNNWMKEQKKVSTYYKEDAKDE